MRFVLAVSFENTHMEKKNITKNLRYGNGIIEGSFNTIVPFEQFFLKNKRRGEWWLGLLGSSVFLIVLMIVGLSV